MRVFYIFTLLSSILFSDHPDATADKIYTDDKALSSSAFGVNMDIGYTNYKIDVNSIELNRAIDYNILELSLGLSYSYDDWLWGVATKSQMDEFESNVVVERGGGMLNDRATIDRAEVAFYTGYKINDSFRLHAVLRKSKLEATDNYVAYVEYDTTFNYKTDGLALSLLYHQTFFNKQALWLSGGLEYSRAKVSIKEYINRVEDDTHIDDHCDSLGYKLGMGYTYLFSKNIILKLSSDYYKFDFSDLNVRSKLENKTIEKAQLKEETYAIRGGFVYRFD